MNTQITQKHPLIKKTIPDMDAVNAATTFGCIGKDLLRVGMELAYSYPCEKIIAGCGPISAHPKTGSLEENLERFEKVIYFLSLTGSCVIDQMPYENKIQELKDLYPDVNLLDEVYVPLFNSGLVTTMVFQPNWRHSPGAIVEALVGLRNRIQLLQLVINWEEMLDIVQTIRWDVQLEDITIPMPDTPDMIRQLAIKTGIDVDKYS